MEYKSIPLELELDFYRRKNRYLKIFSDKYLKYHWTTRGFSEGRQGSPASVRENFVNYASYSPDILEIGPFFRPCITGKNVSYFDVLDKEKLEERARNIGYKDSIVPYINYVSEIGDLSIIDKKFHDVISSHCVEHQPCLVQHLQKVSSILEENGRYFLIIPDKRYCFDHFIAESTIADVLQAYSDNRKLHTLRSVIEHRALTTHNDTIRHWKGDHNNSDFLEEKEKRIKNAIDEYNKSKDNYIDVHAWQFTPESFRSIINILYRLNISQLGIERVYQTPRYRNEFCAILRKNLKETDTSDSSPRILSNNSVCPSFFSQFISKIRQKVKRNKK